MTAVLISLLVLVLLAVAGLTLLILRRGLPGDATALVTSGEVRLSDVQIAEMRERLEAEFALLRQRADADIRDARERAERDAGALYAQVETDVQAFRARAEVEAVARAGRAEQDARDAAAAARARADTDLQALREELGSRATRLDARESRLADGEQRLDQEATRIGERERDAATLGTELSRRRSELADIEAERCATLERLAGLSAADARAQLLRDVEQAARRDAAIIVRDIETDAREAGEARAKEIVALAIQRVASEQTAESVVSVLHLPGDDMKGRIIGREGRNIRSFEAVTGVNVIIDDTPEAVLLSCFDPVRREVARLTLEALVLDGRIHPHRIEETYEKSKTEVEALCRRAAEDAAVAVGCTDLHPELMALLGRLRYRTSYGQNVLKHLVETAHIASGIAAELRVRVPTVKRGAFLHDIGKAVTHEVEGSHAIVGAELARRYGENDDVVHAIEAHHYEVQPRTIEALLTIASDSCSGGRPGARRESLEAYVQRLERVEAIAGAKPGVEKVFAMQAGREVRVMVLPEAVDDLGAQMLARDIAKQIEDELVYPGQIRVTVVRESRASEVAR